MVVSKFFYFHPYLGKISNLNNIFQMGFDCCHVPALKVGPLLLGRLREMIFQIPWMNRLGPPKR